jgi:hypothetical protein
MSIKRIDNSVRVVPFVGSDIALLWQKAEGRGQEAGGRRERQRAEGRRWKGKAEGRRDGRAITVVAADRSPLTHRTMAIDVDRSLSLS